MSTILAEISRPELSESSHPASITDIKYLASYNWIEADTPTIAVPGSPALWRAPKTPQKLQKDQGLVYIAQNAYRHPESPLEPLFRALYHVNPEFDISPVDLVADRNTIRRLLTFVNPGSDRKGLQDFTVKVEVFKNTTIFCRDETATHEIIKPYEFRGYGHNFEKAYTVDKIRGSTGHHRIISYHFGGLSLIIRHETDGFVESGATPSGGKADPAKSLDKELESLSLSTNGESQSITPVGSKLTIRESGRPTPFESNLEIKTRVAHKRLSFNETAAQLWISQTLKLVRAYHHYGVFQPPMVEDVTEPIKEWERQNETDLRKLAFLIGKIVEVVKTGGGKAVIRCDAGRKVLVISKSNDKAMLPADLYQKWHVSGGEVGKTSVESEAGRQSPVKTGGAGDGGAKRPEKPFVDWKGVSQSISNSKSGESSKAGHDNK